MIIIKMKTQISIGIILIKIIKYIDVIYFYLLNYKYNIFIYKNNFEINYNY